MGLPTITTLAGQWLNSLVFHDDIKLITGNGYAIIYVGTKFTYMSCDNHSFAQKAFENC